MGIWEWKEVPKTDKNWQVPLVQKRGKCKQKGCKVAKTVSAFSPNWINMIFSICIYNVIKFFFKKI